MRYNMFGGVMEERTKAEIICDAICGIIMLASVAIFVVIGICTKIWHPTWISVVAGAVVCGIISIVCNMVVGIKKVDAKKVKDNEENKIDEN